MIANINPGVWNMPNVSKAKLTVPKAAVGEILRRELVAAILDKHVEIAYIHAGAGFGKTTLLSQAAHSVESAAWVTLDGESNIFSFLGVLCDALGQILPGYGFTASEYMLFEEKSNFVTIIANAFISSIEKFTRNFMLVLDDLHTIEEPQIRSFIACLLRYRPDNLRICLSSREAPWQELIPLYLKGNILVLSQQELAFTKDEAAEVLGIEDEHVYSLTEGWPLAINSFKVLLENGVSAADVPIYGSEALYSYLFYECVSRLSPEIVRFLEDSSCFEELDPQMLDALSGKKNARLLLESLVSRNIFTVKTGGGYYRYHALFRAYLLSRVEEQYALSLQHKAARHYFDGKQYSKAAEYAIRLSDKEMLEQILLISYREYIKSGGFNELRVWFNALGNSSTALSRELLVAKGAFLSSIGNFTEAKDCLDRAIPLLSEYDSELYIEAMVHKARVLRNFISFEESNRLLDELIDKLEQPASELSYSVVIEKIYNLCWNSQIGEAYTLAYHMVETCAKAGNIKVKAWYERYLSVIHYAAGRMKDSVYCYEKSLELPESERQYLDMHSIDIYVAKAYQMLGERDKAISLVTAGVQRLRSTGRYEELWLGYLFAAEIHYQNTSIDRSTGMACSFETTIRYFTLSDEYAPLYRKSEFHMDWAKLQHNIYSLMFTEGEKEKLLTEIHKDIHKVGDHFKTIAYGRLFNYYGTVSDFASAVKCAKSSIEVGERADTMMVATMAYGFLARVALSGKDYEEAARLLKRFLQLCSQNGIYEYFRMRKAYDPLLEFALANGIEPDFTMQMMEFAGYKIKKAYVTTLGAFSVYPYKHNPEPLKMRTKKERELLAFLLDAGSEGATKDQIHYALWQESNSDDVKKLIGVNLAHIKKDLARLGIENSILNSNKRYSICRDEIVTDGNLFEEAAKEFKRQKNRDTAQKLISLYKGEYLSDFEALWAMGKRISYARIYDEALEFIENS